METYMMNLPLPECTMSVDGTYLEDSILGYRTSSVSGRGSFISKLNEKTLGEIGDTKYLSKRDTPRDILVQYNLVADSREDHNHKLDMLKTMLCTANTKFIFRDESENYYIGTVAAVTSSLSNTGGMNIISSSGEITIHCSDPYKYSTVERVFTAVVKDNVPTITIINDGSKAVPITYNIKHNHENGYLGIVSDKGVIQLGKIEELDGMDYKQSETLMDFDSFEDTSDDHGINYMHPTHGTDGTTAIRNTGGVHTLGINEQGPGDPNKWCGGMRTLVFPADSEGVFGATNFYSYMNHWFETGLVPQTAEQSIAFLTADNKVICGYSLFKSDVSNNRACLEFWINNRVVKSIHFTPSYLDSDNPFNFGRGHNDIRKEGDKVTFYWWGSYPSFVDPAIKDMACTKMQVAFTNWTGRGVGDDYVTRNYIKHLDFTKQNVEKWKDVPNRYKLGDDIFIDGHTTKVYINGMPRPGEEVKGSTYFLAEPGETKIQFYTSSFNVVPPTVTATIRKAWL